MLFEFGSYYDTLRKKIDIWLNTNQILNIVQKQIKVVSKVELLGIQTDEKLKYARLDFVILD